MALPTFVVIGAQKAGTTSLWSYLKVHPDVFMPKIKELNFFIEEGRWRRGRSWYEAQFEGADDHPAAGEASPGYTMFPMFAGAAERMADLLPEAKLIYLVREPIARMRSAWEQSVVDATDLQPLRRALLYDMRYLALSQYALQLEQYLRHYDRSRILVMRAEDLATDASNAVKQVFDFIGADPGFVPPNLDRRENVSEGKLIPKRGPRAGLRTLEALRGRPAAMRRVHKLPGWAKREFTSAERTVDDDLRARLIAMLEPEMERLRGIVGDQFPLWDLETGKPLVA